MKKNLMLIIKSVAAGIMLVAILGCISGLMMFGATVFLWEIAFALRTESWVVSIGVFAVGVFLGAVLAIGYKRCRK